MNQSPEIPAQTDAIEKRALVEQELRLAKEYWLRTVQPHIAARKLRDVELFVAQDAYLRLQVAQKQAADWNRSEKGRLSLLDVDLLGEEFHAPEVLFADENLKPEILAKIAAPLMYKNNAKLTPAEAVRSAHELLMAAERYIRKLPEKKEEADSWGSDIVKGISHYVLFAEIERSNEKASGHLPLLPPVQKQRNEGKLTPTALKSAAKRFLEQKKKNHPQITGPQWDREAAQSQAEEALADCLKSNRIILQDLCDLRWERFKNHWQKQQRTVLSRKSPKKNLPKSASKRRQ